jgi:hypothetical protein
VADGTSGVLSRPRRFRMKRSAGAGRRPFFLKKSPFRSGDSCLIIRKYNIHVVRRWRGSLYLGA